MPARCPSQRLAQVGNLLQECSHLEAKCHGRNLATLPSTGPEELREKPFHSSAGLHDPSAEAWRFEWQRTPGTTRSNSTMSSFKIASRLQGHQNFTSLSDITRPPSGLTYGYVGSISASVLDSLSMSVSDAAAAVADSAAAGRSLSRSGGGGGGGGSEAR